jgi:DHA2 family methylenomycin A resistance protein-like MFS transporter
MGRYALLATSLGFAVVQLDVSVVNVAIKPIGADLGGTVGSLQWVVDAYTITFAALILSAGALGDRIGAKRVFIAGFAAFTVASAACGLAPDLPTLIAGRAAQGVGAALLVPCSLSLLNHAHPEPAERARAVGLWAAGASLAVALGPLVGGLLSTAVSWRAIFFLNAPIGLLGIVLTARFAAETTRSRDRGVDLPGQLLAIVTLVLLSAALIDRRPALLGPAVAAAIAFLLVEARRRRPMLPLGLFRSPQFAGPAAVGLLVNVTFYGLFFVLSLYFQNEHHYSPMAAGLAFLPTAAAVFGANLLAGPLVRRIGMRWVLAGGATLVAASLAALGFVAAGTPYPWIVGQLTVLGLGLGVVVPAATAGLLGSVDRAHSGIASGTLNTARQTGSVIGVALFGTLGLRLDLLIGVALALCAAGLGLTVRPPAGSAS